MIPEEFIDYAERLAVQVVTTPAQARTIVGRAYFGDYHLAARFIATLTNQRRSKHDAHVWLLGSQHPDAHEAGILLALLNNDRIRADYRLDNRRIELPATARQCVEHARDVQRLLLLCQNAPPEEILARR